jgi:hypothetical protein
MLLHRNRRLRGAALRIRYEHRAAERATRLADHGVPGGYTSLSTDDVIKLSQHGI